MAVSNLRMVVEHLLDNAPVVSLSIHATIPSFFDQGVSDTVSLVAGHERLLLERGRATR